ncbi:MAG: leucine--tRNA ligase [Candidatus Doudnabacteria bacterium]|jgi:leucyl-tRNA synthetase
MIKYDHKKIESRWQEYWEKNKTFSAKDNSKKPKKYVLVEFPYPSGAGLHMGHLRPYVAGDVYSRYNRMKGFETLFPMGWDAFGLPAENYAIKMGVHPSITTASNIKNAKRQIKSWGLSFDWDREVNTTDPEYYKWTQWLFLQFYKKGLAYESTGLINWCPKDKTGLANEEVIDGKCERCGTSVEKKELRQWYLRITAYAEKLLEGLKNLPEWPEAVKLQQANWIGKKTGINITYDIDQEKSNYIILHGRNGSPESHLFPWLKQTLESKGFVVQAPMLPNSDEPNDIEQAEFIIKNCKIDENTVIVGHSFGGVSALRILEQGIKIRRLVLISTPFSGKFLDNKVRKSVTDACRKGFDFKKIKQNAEQFNLLFDTSDYVVPMSDGEEFAKNLGTQLMKEKGQEPHFSASEEPAVLNLIYPQVTVFTTRPDTNFGATFLVIGPEHPLLAERNILNIEEKYWGKIVKYKKHAIETADMDRTDEGRKKTGVFTGLYCINTLNNYRMPLYVADYVLGNVGTGAVVGVPAHDKRDFEFAEVFKLEVKRVVQKDANDTAPITSIDQVQEEEGKMVNSDFLNGLDIHEATTKIMDYMEEKGYGKRVINYKLRDWVFSRQRYWGEPIPLIHCEDCGIVPVPEKDLPVKLPNVKKYEPTGTGESPLAEIKKWLKTTCPKCKKVAWRETNTMPQWAGSSWYWLRYADSKNKTKFADLKKLKYWQPVDVYFGGMEHTTLHLLYSRFWNLFLYDQGLVTVPEPYKKRHPHGIILGPDGEKMSKSRGNVVNPDDVVKVFGADTLRMYELFLGPHEATVSWNDKGVVGVKRFLDRIWNWVNEIAEAPHAKQPSSKYQAASIKDGDKVQRALHKLIKKITEDIENFRFNTSISAFMEFHNEIKEEFITLESVKTFLILLYPFAPHISEELHQIVAPRLRPGSSRSIKSLQQASWPTFDLALTIDSTVEMVFQINGKVKGKLTVSAASTQEAVQALVVATEVVKQALVGETIKRVIFVPNRLINLVI